MIKVRVNNSKNTDTHTLARECALFAIKKLMPRKRYLNVHINFKNMSEWGACEMIFIERNPVDFVIEIRSSLSKRNMMQTIFHEMTHVQQMSSNKLRYLNKGTMWCKENHEDTPYSKQPWEIEARKNEKLLYEMFVSDK